MGPAGGLALPLLARPPQGGGILDTLANWLRGATAGTEPALSGDLLRRLRALDRPEELAEMASRHGVAPWVFAACAATPGAAELPLLEPLRRAALEQTTATIALFAELSRILQALAERGIEVIVLKGPALASRYYSEPGLRPYRDLDLVVRERDLDAAAQMLEADGYEEWDPAAEPGRLHHEHAIFQRKHVHAEDGRVVELHCDHLQIGLEPVGMEEIWDRSEAASFGRGAARVLEPNDLFVHLGVHLHRHGFARLIWFKDLDLMVRSGELDWSVVRRRAREQGCEASVAYALELLQPMLGTPLPAGARGVARGGAGWSRWMLGLLWRRGEILSLKPQRRWRYRRAVQFAPEAGLVRGGLPSLLFTGRRADKLRVLASSARSARRRACAARGRGQ